MKHNISFINYQEKVKLRRRPLIQAGNLFVALAFALLALDSACAFLPPTRLGKYTRLPKYDTTASTHGLSLAKRRSAGGPKTKKGGAKPSKKGKPPKKNKNAPAKKNPMSGSSGGGGGALKKSSGRQPRQPPWQVLSKKDAKKNVQLEKSRRERVQQGLPNEETVLEESTISKSFLSNEDRNFVSWKRFNPSSASSGMRFLASVLDKRMPPRLGVPEVAFLGRSNVGKSSLLNRLSSYSKREAGFNDEARVGKTPGATASVNLYAFYDKKEKPLLGFVDLPGFGYAKLSKGVKESVQQTAENYLAKRTELCLGILLVDIRRVPSEDDRIVLAALYDMGVPIVVVATKVDKANKNEIDLRLEGIRDGLGLPEGQPLCISSVTGEGTKNLWNIIFEACETGVEEFRQKFERGGPEMEEDDEDEEFDDDDEAYYSQGYDWVQGSRMDPADEYGAYDAFDSEEDYDDMDETGEAVDVLPSREFGSIRELRKQAKRLEKTGGV